MKGSSEYLLRLCIALGGVLFCISSLNPPSLIDNYKSDNHSLAVAKDPWKGNEYAEDLYKLLLIPPDTLPISAYESREIALFGPSQVPRLCEMLLAPESEVSDGSKAKVILALHQILAWHLGIDLSASKKVSLSSSEQAAYDRMWETAPHLWFGDSRSEMRINTSVWIEWSRKAQLRPNSR